MKLDKGAPISSVDHSITRVLDILRPSDDCRRLRRRAGQTELAWRSICLVLTLCPALAAVARAQSPAPPALPASARYLDAAGGMTVQKLVETALAKNAELLATRQRIAEALGQLEQSRLRPNPGLNIRIGNGSVLRSAGERHYSISYAHTFELGGKWSRRVEVSRLAVELATLEVAEQQRLLRASVKTRFAEALALVQKLEIAEQLLQLNEQSYRVAQARVNEGEAAELEERLMRVEVNRMRSEQMLFDSQVERAILELKRLAGLEPDEPLKLSGSLDLSPVELSLAQAMGRALTMRPDLQAAKLAEKLAEAEIGLARAEGTPNLLGSLEYSRTSARFALFGLNSAGQLVPVRDTDNILGIGISVDLPFRNRNQGNVQSAQARSHAAALRRAYVERAVRQEVEAAFSRYETARRALGAFNRGVIIESLDNLKMVRAAYQFGELRILDVLNEQRRFMETQGAWTDLLRECYLALVELEKATGDSLF